jgi:hypothetical protein
LTKEKNWPFNPGCIALRFAKALVGGDKECVGVGVSMERKL